MGVWALNVCQMDVFFGKSLQENSTLNSKEKSTCNCNQHMRNNGIFRLMYLTFNQYIDRAANSSDFA